MANDYDLARFNYDNYRYCYDNGHQDWLVKAYRCMEFWKGNQWDVKDLRRLQQAGRPALTFNVVEALVRAMTGMQRALRNDVRFAPSTDADQAASVMDALWLNVQNSNKLDFLETDVYNRGLVTSRAFYDVRVDFNESMRGDVSIKPLRAQDVLLDPGFLEYDPHEWPQVISQRWTNALDIQYSFGKDKAEAVKGTYDPTFFDYEDMMMSRQFADLPYYSLGYTNGEIDTGLVRALKIISRQYYVLKNKECFVDTATGDISEIPESWDHNRISRVLSLTEGLTTMKRQIKTVRWVETCNDVVLHNEDSPYKWFTVVPFFPIMLDGHTMGAVEHLCDPQMLFNKVTSQELHIINTTANSGWITKKGNIKNLSAEEMETVGARTGIYIEVEDIAQIEKIQPNQTPQGHDRISFKANQIMRDLAGQPNSVRGLAREDVSGSAIETNIAAADVNSATWLSNLYRSRQILAERARDCMQAYYTETRAIMINRGSVYRPDFEKLVINGMSPEGQVINDVTQGKYTTVMVPSPTRVSMSEGEFETLVKLRTEVGIQIPDDLMLELAPVNNKAMLIQRLKGDSTSADQQQKALEAAQAQGEVQLTQAQIAKEQGAAQLNEARANKANAEAQSDPDAAYKTVELARIQSEHTLDSQRIGLDQQKLGLERRGQNRQTAIDLTKIDADASKHRQSMLVELSKNAAKAPPKQPPKKQGAAAK